MNVCRKMQCPNTERGLAFLAISPALPPEDERNAQEGSSGKQSPSKHTSADLLPDPVSGEALAIV